MIGAPPKYNSFKEFILEELKFSKEHAQKIVLLESQALGNEFNPQLYTYLTQHKLDRCSNILGVLKTSSLDSTSALSINRELGLSKEQIEGIIALKTQSTEEKFDSQLREYLRKNNLDTFSNITKFACLLRSYAYYDWLAKKSDNNPETLNHLISFASQGTISGITTTMHRRYEFIDQSQDLTNSIPTMELGQPNLPINPIFKDPESNNTVINIKVDKNGYTFKFFQLYEIHDKGDDATDPRDTHFVYQVKSVLNLKSGDLVITWNTPVESKGKDRTKVKVYSPDS